MVADKHKKCGNCKDFPCDDSGGHLRTDPICDFFNVVDLKERRVYRAPGEELPEFMDGKRFVPKVLGDDILKHYNIVTFPDSMDIGLFINGVFNIANGAQLLQEIITEKLDDFFQKNRLQEVITYIQISTYTSREEMNKYTYLINVRNGMYDVMEDKLLPHDQKYKSTIQLNVVYDPAAECPVISKFLSEVTTPEGQAKVIQYAGYACTPDIKFQRTLLIDGPQQNGKSTFLEMLCHMIGQENTSQQSIQSLNDDRFAREQLNNKLVNFYGDLPAKKLHDNSVFKMLTSDQYIDGEKKYGQKFRYKNTIHQMYALNKVPELSDPGELAFFRRLLCVTFPKSFEGEADRGLSKKITTDTEISGFFNYAMVGLRILLEMDEFCYNKTVEDIQKEYLNKSNPVATFLDECTEYCSGEIIKKGLYETFKAWCEQYNVSLTIKDNSFAQAMIKMGYESYRKSGGTRDRYWLNIGYITEGKHLYKSVQAIENLDDYKRHQSAQPSRLPGSNHILNYTNIKYIIYSGYREKNATFTWEPGRIDIEPLAEDTHFVGQANYGARTTLDGSQRDTVNFIKSTILNLQVDGKTPITTVLDHAIDNGITFDRCKAAIKRMKADGSIFEPAEGFYKCI